MSDYILRYIYYKIYMNNSEVRGHGDIKKIE